MKYDEIQKAKHYNVHPSGVEVIELSRHLPTSLGTAMKYLMRAGLKGSPEDAVKDYKKAIWYIKDYDKNPPHGLISFKGREVLLTVGDSEGPYYRRIWKSCEPNSALFLFMSYLPELYFDGLSTYKLNKLLSRIQQEMKPVSLPAPELKASEGDAAGEPLKHEDAHDEG